MDEEPIIGGNLTPDTGKEARQEALSQMLLEPLLPYNTDHLHAVAKKLCEHFKYAAYMEILKSPDVLSLIRQFSARFYTKMSLVSHFIPGSHYAKELPFVQKHWSHSQNAHNYFSEAAQMAVDFTVCFPEALQVQYNGLFREIFMAFIPVNFSNDSDAAHMEKYTKDIKNRFPIPTTTAPGQAINMRHVLDILPPQ